MIARRRAPTTLLGLVVLLVWPGPAVGQSLEQDIDPAERFQAGNRHYQDGDFAAASEAYAQILEAGFESGDLHYNLGNAYFKLGRLGPAILSYERARKALPRDENVLANLELARALSADQITPLDGFWLTNAWNGWVDLLPRRTLIAVVTLGYLLVMILVIARVLSRSRGRRLGHLAIATSVVTLAFGSSLVVREYGLGRADWGVIMATETPVQSAPADDPALQLFSIHEGTRVRIDRRSDGWYEVVLEDGKVGWVRAGTLEVI
jgi:tetratricopeptide (TPR) repeat protein